MARSPAKPQPLTGHRGPLPGASCVVGSLGPRERSPGVGSQLCPLKPELRQSPLGERALGRPTGLGERRWVPKGQGVLSECRLMRRLLCGQERNLREAAAARGSVTVEPESWGN